MQSTGGSADERSAVVQGQGESELRRFREVVELVSRLNRNGSASSAVSELVRSVYQLLEVRSVVVFLCGWQQVNSSDPEQDVRRTPTKCLSPHDDGERYLYPVLGDVCCQRLKIGSDESSTTVAGWVAFSNKTKVLNNLGRDTVTLVSDDPLRNHTNATLIPISFDGSNSGSCTGVLACLDKPDGFSDTDVAVLEALAACAASMLHKLVLYENAMAAQRKASALLDLAHASRGVREEQHIRLPVLIQRLLVSVYRVMRADRVSLYFADNSRRELWCCISKDYAGSRIPFGVGIIGTVANSGLTLNIRDCYRDPRFSRRGDMSTGYCTRSLLAVPVMSSSGNLLAVLCVINKLAVNGSNEPIMPVLDKVPREADSNDADSCKCDKPVPFASFTGAELHAGESAHRKDAAGITHFTLEDEVILESVGAEIGGLLERNALDTHYENVINELRGDRPGARDGRGVDYSKLLAASLLAETTNSDDFRAGVRIASDSSSKWMRGESSRLLGGASLELRHKAILCKRVTRLTYFFRAVGIFARRLQLYRGFQVSVLGSQTPEGASRIRRRYSKSSEITVDPHVLLSSEPDSTGRGASAGPEGSGSSSALKSPLSGRRNSKRIGRRSWSSTMRPGAGGELAEAQTAILPGAQYVVGIDQNSALVVAEITEDSRGASLESPVPNDCLKVLPEADQVLVERSREWCLDVFSLSEREGILIVQNALGYLGLVEHFSIDPRTVVRLSLALKRSYLSSESCPYHNWEHGLGVFQMSFAMLCQTQLRTALQPVEHLALLIGALGHDAGHPGRNNDFEVKTGSDLAVRYNDRSVLENHHASLLFQILRQPESQLLRYASRSQVAAFRKLTLDAVLATDASGHMELVKSMASHITSPPASPGSASAAAAAAAAEADPVTASCSGALYLLTKDREGRSLLLNFVLHSVDIAGQCYPRHLSERWSERLISEFVSQAAEETQLGFQPAPYMVGLESPLRRAALQKSFTQNVLQPAWNLVYRLFPETEPLLHNLQDNIQRYGDQIAELKQASDTTTNSSAGAALTA